MTDSEVATLVEHYLRDGNRLIKYRAGYRSLSPDTRRELNRLDPQPSAFGSYNKTNPHTKRRWSSYENK
jgi:hypothetical protein